MRRGYILIFDHKTRSKQSVNKANIKLAYFSKVSWA